MAFTERQQAKVMEAIREKLPHFGACNACHKGGWTLMDGFVHLQLSDDVLQVPQPGASALPCVALLCNNCGNTMLFNIIMLGIGDVFGVAEAAAR